jgi:hypothetical protein
MTRCNSSFLPTLLAVLPAIYALPGPSFAIDRGQYQDAPADLRQWFRSQQSPKTGEYCCDEADGTYAEEDIREGQYWARWPTVGEWQRVPDDVIIRSPNRAGAPVVWWHYDATGIAVRCYAPGGKV